MTTPPKTMEEIRDAEAKKYHGWGTSANQAYKYGFDCAFNESEKRTRVTNEALRIAVEALNKVMGEAGTSTLANKICANALAEIRKLRGEG